MTGQSMSYSNNVREESISNARPKLLRRPAQFSSPVTPTQAIPTPPSTELTAQPVPALPTPLEFSIPSTTGRSWQDDGRFGVMMIAIVLLTNLVLMLWLPHLAKSEKIAAAATPNNTVSSVMPTATAGPTPQITTYSRAADGLPNVRVVTVHQLSPMTDSFTIAPITRHVLDESTEDSDQ